jgi:hypothetical protein
MKKTILSEMVGNVIIQETKKLKLIEQNAN